MLSAVTLVPVPFGPVNHPPNVAPSRGNGVGSAPNGSPTISVKFVIVPSPRSISGS